MTRDAETIKAALAGRVGDFHLDIRFDVPASGITGIYGPSGCGKTTLLRAIAGLHRLDGTFRIGTETWQDTEAGLYRPAHQRATGYVFQEASLFPHLSVEDNLLFGTRTARAGPGAAGFSRDEIVDMFAIEPLLGRPSSVLSGGERQRVAIGRALLARPRLLLFDEPLSALDHQSREDIFPYLETLQQRVAVPCLYVSHDRSELARLADMIVVMDQGTVTACGPLAALESDPALPLLRARDAAVTLTGTVAEIDKQYGLAQLALPGGMLTVPLEDATPGARKRLQIRAADVSFTREASDQTSILNCLPVRVISIIGDERDPAHVNVVAALGPDGGGARLIGRITRKSRDQLGLHDGDKIFAQIKSVALMRRHGG